jgi:hypothetical protein
VKTFKQITIWRQETTWPMILKHIRDKRLKFADLCFNRPLPTPRLIPITVRPMFMLRGAYNCKPYTEGGITSMHCSLFNLISVLHSVLHFWKLLVFEFLLPTRDLFNVYSWSKNVPLLLDVFQFLMLFVVTLMYFVQTRFLLIIFYNGISLMIKILIIFNINIWIQLVLEEPG